MNTPQFYVMVGAKYLTPRPVAARNLTDEKSHAALFEADEADRVVDSLTRNGKAARKVPA